MTEVAIDLSEFDAAAPSRSTCWHRKLSEEQQAKVDAAHAAGYGRKTIAKVVSDWGVKISSSPVGNHYSAGHECK